MPVHSTLLLPRSCDLFPKQTSTATIFAVVPHCLIAACYKDFSLSAFAREPWRITLANELPDAGAARKLSLDTWAVAAALILALLVRLGIIQKVPW